MPPLCHHRQSSAVLTFSHLDNYLQSLVILWGFAEDAELTFCPYNYLVDPVIRKSMGIDIRNAVLIFDEAHNIEDISRSGPPPHVQYNTCNGPPLGAWTA
jgi:Rad3-related DNA helicase